MAVTGVSGLASGIDSAAIIDALVKADRAGAALIEGKRDKIKAKLEATRNLNTRLLTAQVDLANLKSASTFQGRGATTGNAAVVTAAATSKAVVGSYAVTVTQEAKAQQVSTGGFASSTASIGTGAVTIQVGDGAFKTITLDATNSTLDGLAAAINAAAPDVSAQVINDGSSQPFRLVLTAKKTGAANLIKFNADALVGGLSDRLQSVVQGTALGSTSAVTGGGIYTGSNGPKDYLVEVVDGGAVDDPLTTFRYSTDGGATWSAARAATSGSNALDNGVAVTFGAGTLAAGEQYTVHPLQQLSTAQDANVRYGSGASYVSVASASNTISNLIAGVTLTVVGPGSTTVTVSADTKSAKDAITGFVTSFNNAIDYLEANASYDATTKTAGILFANTDVRRGVDSIKRSLLSAVPNLPITLDTVGAIGISVDRDSGKLVVDDTKLAATLAADPDGVAKLFTNTATSSSADLQFATLTSKTDATSPFLVDITQAARQAHVLSGGALAASTDVDSTNNSLDLTINGHAYSVTLGIRAGYTRDELAKHIEETINAAVGNPADRVAVALNGDSLDLHSQLYGSSQSIQVTGGTAVTGGTDILHLATTAVAGTDVAGTINGVAASGVGQVLKGVAGSSSDGLRLISTATAPTSGVTLAVRKGLAQVAGEGLLAMTDTASGTLTKAEDGFTAMVDDMNDRIADLDVRLDARKKRYQAQFLQMEKLIQQFQSQGNLMAGQIAGFANMAASRANGT